MFGCPLEPEAEYTGFFDFRAHEGSQKAIAQGFFGGEHRAILRL